MRLDRCIVCDGPLVQAVRGRPRETCSAKCRQVACRRQRVIWPTDFETAEEALIGLVVDGREDPPAALLRIVSAWRAAVAA